MADGHAADKGVKFVAVKNLRHQSHADVLAELPAVAGDNARAFLAAMLEGVQAVVRQLGGIRMAVNAEHAAVVFGIMLHLLLRARRHIQQRFPASRKSQVNYSAGWWHARPTHSGLFHKYAYVRCA